MKHTEKRLAGPASCSRRIQSAWMVAPVVTMGLMLLTHPGAIAQVMQDSIIGDNNMTSSNTGVAVNGSTSGATINNNQNNLSTGSNVNSNTVSPVVVTPYSGVQGGNGGGAALVLPRNPLPIPNAMYGRSNFGLQFGVQNNPGLSTVSGGNDALGFFVQGGLTIPFGKIPEALTNPENRRLDDARMQRMDGDRMVYGTPLQNRAQTNVQGKVVELNAYNYSPASFGKLQTPPLAPTSLTVEEPALQRPRVMALESAKVYSHPLNTGQEIGMVELGREYPYLGHTSRGWVKVLLPSGKEGWTSTQLEYIKFDYTQIDTLAVDPAMHPQKTAQLPTSKVKAPTR
ncbi:MAG TPA: SH3 domain-containing protein [Coleofasciculaceae cyanobacterium]